MRDAQSQPTHGVALKTASGMVSAGSIRGNISGKSLAGIDWDFSRVSGRSCDRAFSRLSFGSAMQSFTSGGDDSGQGVDRAVCAVMHEASCGVMGYSQLRFEKLHHDQVCFADGDVVGAHERLSGGGAVAFQYRLCHVSVSATAA